MIARRFVALLALVLVVLATPTASRSAPPAPAGEVYLVQGVVDSEWELSVDGEVVKDGVAAKEIVPAGDLDPGSHEVTATSDDGTSVAAAIDVKAGQSLDVVLHLPVEADGTPVLTSFVNDRSPVPAGSTRLSIAHTAAVGPADIEVDGQVLFADVASGEELTVVVPGDTYRVAVVPAATDSPPVLGPVDLPVPPGKLMRVFAVGVAAEGTMDAVVHTMDVPVSGSQERPSDVPGGSGGPTYADEAVGGPGVLGWAGLACLAGALVLLGSALVRRSVPDHP
ncbi:DUF4397 domain-containing protein [Nocardioides sp.]|uniref:DUF4397 domain-containing protein n=1 Tax=Nocardioides sp. TaxID=35761 RepID=UPI002ED601DC